MPTYEYRCAKCGKHLEVYQSFSEDPLTKHESCGGKLTKVLSPAGIVLKGSGFYKTDSRASSGRSKPAAEKKSEKKSETSSESASSPSDTKSSGTTDQGASKPGGSGGTDAKSA